MTGRGISGRWLAAAGALAALLCAGQAGTAAAAVKRIVYADTFATGNFDIFSVRPNGTGLKRLTRSRLQESDPSWSPRHRSIVYSREGHLVTMRGNGSRRRGIPGTRFAGEPAWSPNGRTIAYSASRGDDRSAVFTIRRDGTRRQRLTRYFDSAPDLDPAWSPSGKSIVFAGPEGVVRMRANGRRKRLLVAGATQPSYSSSGRRIAFELGGDLYVARASGTHRRNVSDGLPDGCGPGEEDCGREDQTPVWSPSGRRLAFATFFEGSDEGGIFSMRSNGSGLRRLTRGGETPDW